MEALPVFFRDGERRLPESLVNWKQLNLMEAKL